MEDKLAGQVCFLANTCRGALKADAAAFLKRRTSKWMKERHVDQAELEKAAEDLKRRYPSSITGMVSPTRQPRSASAAVGSGSKAAFAKKGAPSPSAKKDSNNAPPTSITPNVDNSPSRGDEAAEDLAIPTRPTVLKRLLEMKSNQKWQGVVQSEMEKFRAEEEANAERKRQMKEQMRKDMAEAERFRLLKEQEKKKEREENRHMVHSVMKDVEEEERLKVFARREKELRERKDMEQQRLDKIKADADRKVAQKAENARIRQEIAEDIALYELEQTEHHRSVREGIKKFLDDSKRILDERKARQRDELLRQKMIDEQNQKSPDATTKNALMGERLHQLKLEAVKKRQQLQDAVARTYSRLEIERQEKDAQLERRTATAMEIRNKEVEQRQIDDMEKKRKMRDKLVASLDLEIHLREERKKEEEARKLKLRQLIDADTSKYYEEHSHDTEKVKGKQHVLCEQLDEQVKLRFQRLLKPQKLKITEVNPPVA